MQLVLFNEDRLDVIENNRVGGRHGGSRSAAVPSATPRLPNQQHGPPHPRVDLRVFQGHYTGAG